MLNKLFAKKLSNVEQQLLIERLTDLILKKTNPRCVILFGSAARMQMTDTSDLDVLMVFDTENELKDARKKTTDLSILLDWPVDKLFYTNSEFQRLSELGGVSMIAAEEGKILFSKADNA